MGFVPQEREGELKEAFERLYVSPSREGEENGEGTERVSNRPQSGGVSGSGARSSAQSDRFYTALDEAQHREHEWRNQRHEVQRNMIAHEEQPQGEGRPSRAKEARDYRLKVIRTKKAKTGAPSHGAPTPGPVAQAGGPSTSAPAPTIAADAPSNGAPAPGPDARPGGPSTSAPAPAAVADAPSNGAPAPRPVAQPGCPSTLASAPAGVAGQKRPGRPKGSKNKQPTTQLAAELPEESGRPKRSKASRHNYAQLHGGSYEPSDSDNISPSEEGSGDFHQGGETDDEQAAKYKLRDDAQEALLEQPRNRRRLEEMYNRVSNLCPPRFKGYDQLLRSLHTALRQ
mmetsp:Transcript_15414/g.41734  ORF Transcript_15414/g.41734 Transcript_15414/m.41734 type:complete len:342 (-) Transcript_15414:215-1240(-)